MKIDALRGMLGLAQRAGRMQSGSDMAIQTIRAGKAKLALLDEGASGNAEKRLQDACEYYSVPMYRLPRDLLSVSCGRSGRVMAVLTDQGFADKVKQLITEE